MLENSTREGRKQPHGANSCRTAQRRGDAEYWVEMSRLQQVITALLVLACLAAVGVCLWALVYHGNVTATVIAAVLMLGLAQLAGYLTRSREPVSDDGYSASYQHDAALYQSLEQLQDDVAQLKYQVSRLETEAAGQSGETAAQLAKQVRSLELTVAALKKTRAAPSRPASPDVGEASPAPTLAKPNRAGRTESDRPDLDQFELYLEPIVRLPKERTAYYRTSLAVPQPDGTRIGVKAFQSEARQGGYAVDLDMLAFERCAPVLRKLQSRQRSLAMFCTVTAHSFSSDQFRQALLDFVEANSDIAGSLVIEVSQRTLGQLTAKGTEGLAYLARLGATFSLTETHKRLPDLTSLTNLGFSFMDIDADALAEIAESEGSADSAAILRAVDKGLSVIVANVTTRDQLARIEGRASLARGSLFSPPRQVRHELSVPNDGQEVA